MASFPGNSVRECAEVDQVSITFKAGFLPPSPFEETECLKRLPPSISRFADLSLLNDSDDWRPWGIGQGGLCVDMNLPRVALGARSRFPRGGVRIFGCTLWPTIVCLAKVSTLTTLPLSSRHPFVDVPVSYSGIRQYDGSRGDRS